MYYFFITLKVACIIEWVWHFFRKETSCIQKRKRSHQPRGAVVGKVMQNTPEVTKPQENQVQAIEAKDEDEAVVEEEAVTKDVEDELGASTDHNKRHQL